jgi:hypothetical protein
VKLDDLRDAIDAAAPLRRVLVRDPLPADLVEQLRVARIEVTTSPLVPEGEAYVVTEPAMRPFSVEWPPLPPLRSASFLTDCRLAAMVVPPRTVAWPIVYDAPLDPPVVRPRWRRALARVGCIARIAILRWAT